LVEVVEFDEDLPIIRRLPGLRATLRFFHRIPPDLLAECSVSSTAVCADILNWSRRRKQRTRKSLLYQCLDMTWIA